MGLCRRLHIRIGGEVLRLSNLPALRYHPSQCGINGGAVMTTKGLALAICAFSVLLASGDLAWSASSTKTSLLRGVVTVTNTNTNTSTNTNSATGGRSTATNSNTNVAVAIAIQRQQQSQQQQQQQLQHQRQSVSPH
jgi:hypothetical protein